LLIHALVSIPDFCYTTYSANEKALTGFKVNLTIKAKLSERKRRKAMGLSPEGYDCLAAEAGSFFVKTYLCRQR